MTASQIDMHRLQEAVRLHRLENSRRSIAGSLKMGRATLRRYFSALEAAGLLDGDPSDLPDLAELRAAATAGVPRKPAPQARSSVATWAAEIQRLYSGGAGPTAIHDYLRLHASGYTGTVSAMKRFCRQLAKTEGPKATDVAIPVVTLPGDVAQVDFCYGGKRYDSVSKVMRKTWIFIMTLGHSRSTYAEFVFDQKVETWIRIHINAFEYFGGVPRVVVPDNLKAAVIRNAFGGKEDAVLNRSYRELARAYGFQIDPTPVRSPEKKGKVERDAQYIEMNFLSTLPEVDVSEAQRLLLIWLREVAGRRCHGTTKRAPLDVFEAEEKPALRALPSTRWRPVIWKRVTVHRDSHVQVAGALYSAPWKYLHTSIWARCTDNEVSLVAKDEVLYRHRRGTPGTRTTVDSHLPEGRRDLRERSRGAWEARAAAMGDEVSTLVAAIFGSDDVLLNLRRVQQVVTLLERYPASRAKRAALRALHFETLEYRSLKGILTKGLDFQPLDCEQTARAWSTGSRFARQPTLPLPFPPNP